MDFLQSGVRTLKRHSISNISDAIRNHMHRDSFSGLGRHLFSPSKANDFPLKNAEFASVSAAVVLLFQKKKFQENELSTLQEAVRNVMTTEAGSLIYDYYKDKLIKKGMVILKETIKHEIGQTLLTKLGEQWNYFYGEILPLLQALLYPVKAKTLTLRQVTLLEFRNTVLLKLPVKEALQELSQSEQVPPAVQQMLLVLHGVHEYPCTDNFIELEKLVARATPLHFGIMGLYSGGSEPELRKISDDTTESDDELAPVDQRLKSPGLSPQGHRLHHKRSSGLLHYPLLSAVREHERGQIRRYSIATT
ncbi:proline-rich protein 5-like isoform X2 [Mercenaria mercenaria]|uniref:proline-rich protein 5-like isoform X2 n=1 Tax=Mercenaria mercenaria TaxID=6596 RepID=UPI00234F2203|nr:proline-rich protein 5-like isoform X2 [Mercenaria mercenaria]